MNPSVAVAFLTKMKLIFETDAAGNPQKDKFLAFQNGAFPVAKEDFYFMEPAKYGLGAGDTSRWTMNFSKMFNFVSTLDDVVTSTPDDLDVVYHDILTTCVPANSRRSAEQQQRYEQALQFLQQAITTSTGESVNILTNYDQYDTAYKQALSVYKNGKIAAENAEGEGADTIRRQWAEEEPGLKRACDLAMLDWEVKGRKTEVENRLSEFNLLCSDSPITTVAGLKSDYDQFAKATAVDTLANEISYLPTHFSPINFFDDAVPWSKLSLDKAEINGLILRAPERLRKLFDIDTVIDIENMTLDYTVVEIVREWFNVDDFLLQRFWKLPEGSAIISDERGQGRLPSFPEKMVFVRNVRTVSKKTTQTPPISKPPVRFNTQLFLNVKPSVAPSLQNKTQLFQTRQSQNQAVISKYISAATKTGQPPTLTRPVLSKSSVPQKGAPIVLQKANPATLVQPMVALRSDAMSMAATPKISSAATVNPPVSASAVAATRVTGRFNTPPIIPVSKNPPIKTAPAPQVEIVEQKPMELLGFICRVMPTCPNPDPQLPWM